MWRPAATGDRYGGRLTWAVKEGNPDSHGTRHSIVQRYSVPQSPTVVIMYNDFDLLEPSWMSERSVSVKEKPKTLRLSAVWSASPNLAPASRSSQINFHPSVADGSIRCRTYDHCPYERVVKNPARGNVGDAQSTMAVADLAKDSEQGLKQIPVAPRLQNHVEVLNMRVLS